MSTKYIYILRHAETIMNEQNKRQGSEGGLSELGKKQADELGKRLINFKINKIFSSPWQRADETSQIINKYLKVKIEKSELLVERRNPTSIIGHEYDEKNVVNKINLMDRSYHTADFRVEDEENFAELKERAIKLKKFLEKKSTSRTLCVTHSTFLKMFLCVIKYGEDLTVEEYIKNIVFNPASNAGITLLSLEKSILPFSKCTWKIILYNETLSSVESKSV